MNAANISMLAGAATGAVFIAPLGTSMPTDASTALANTWKCIGYTDESGIGLTETFDRAWTHAWERRFAKEVDNGNTVELTVTPLESCFKNADVAKMMFGDSAVTTDNSGNVTAITGASVRSSDWAIVIEAAIDGGSQKVRACIPHWHLVRMDTFTMARGKTSMPMLTGQCLPTDGAEPYKFHHAVPATVNGGGGN